MTATEARALVRRARCGALATLFAGDDGRPYVSLVTLACDCDLSPILLLSDLADHTRNLSRDARASLLVEEASRRANPQTGARVSLIGRVVADATPRLRRRFLARHPGAAVYSDFADFHIFRLIVERAHHVGGFGRAQWLTGEAILSPAGAEAIAAGEEEILTEANREHGETITMLARHLLGLRGDGWQLAGVDPDGCDLRRGSTLARLPFADPATDPSAVWQALKTLFSRVETAPEPPSAPPPR